MACESKQAVLVGSACLRFCMHGYTSIFIACSVISFLIFPLNGSAASGKLAFKFTLCVSTVMVPEIPTPITEKLKLPVLSFQSSCRLLIVLPWFDFTVSSSPLILLSALSCSNGCGIVRFSFGMLLFLSCCVV